MPKWEDIVLSVAQLEPKPASVRPMNEQKNGLNCAIQPIASFLMNLS